MTYKVLFYDPRNPFRQLVESFTNEDTANRWAALVRANGWKVDGVEKV